MRAKVFMENVRRAEQELRLLGMKRTHYMELATLTGSPSGPVISKTEPSSRVENGAVNLVDLAAQIDRECVQYLELLQLAEDAIKKVPQDKYRQFLTIHYLCGKSLPETSELLEYKDSKSIYKVRRWALQALQKVIDRPPEIG